MTTLSWDFGTAYDLFISLHVLHHPARFGLRPSWAAGVRSRLPSAQREFLEVVQTFLPVPLAWLHTLPEDRKDACGAIALLAEQPAEQRLPALMLNPYLYPDLSRLLKQVAGRKYWNESDLLAVRAAYHERHVPLQPAQAAALLDAWVEPEEFGENFLAALEAYQSAFFAEEELRIRPALAARLDRARERASQLPVPALVEELSRGVQVTGLLNRSELVLVPSYWSAPLIFYGQVDEHTDLVVFGARPESQPLVPGEHLPAALVDSLKALADPTRLRILRYLAVEPLTPVELARRLRLRPPTVIHHLNALRLAGLVQVTLLASGERRYALRSGAVPATLDQLQQFLSAEAEKPPQEAHPVP